MNLRKLTYFQLFTTCTEPLKFQKGDLKKKKKFYLGNLFAQDDNYLVHAELKKKSPFGTLRKWYGATNVTSCYTSANVKLCWNICFRQTPYFIQFNI